MARLAEEGVSGSSGARILHSLVMLETFWGGLAIHRSKWGLGNTVLKTVATPEQIEKWKNYTISIAITEPSAGSDPANIRTTATFDRETDEWILNGEKIFISQAQSADAAMVFSRFIAPDGSRGMTTFLVEKGTPGFTIGPQLKKLGIRSHDTCNLLFENCRIPEFNHIKGDFKSTMSVFNDSRPMVAATALGVARAALDFTREKLAERGVEISYGAGARSRSAIADRVHSAGGDARGRVAHGDALPSGSSNRTFRPRLKPRSRKLPAARPRERSPRDASNYSVPRLLSEDHLLDRCFRDGRIFDIYEGAGEIQRLIIARSILGYTNRDLR